MPRAFNVNAGGNHFDLPAHTKRQIANLLMYLDTSAREVVIRAVADLWDRELGEPDRDLAAEIDEIKSRLDQLIAV